jgi:hypothetical protein
MRRLAATVIVAALAGAPWVAGAQSAPGAQSTPGAQPDSGSQATPKADGPSATDRLQEGAAAIVDGLRMLMDQLQSYQPPEVLPNGDIIIRRRPPEEAEPPAKPETPDGNSLKL